MKKAANLIKRETEILEWRGDTPVIKALRYSEWSLFFWCCHCKRFHYHRSAGMQSSRCTDTSSPFRRTGYILVEASYVA